MKVIFYAMTLVTVKLRTAKLQDLLLPRLSFGLLEHKLDEHGALKSEDVN